MPANIGQRLEEAGRCLNELREKKRATDESISSLYQEQNHLKAQIDNLRTKLTALNEKIANQEFQRNALQETIDRADTSYAVLLESSQSLIDYVKKEYDGLAKSLLYSEPK